MNIQTKEAEKGVHIVRISGRIDSMTSLQLEDEFDKLTSAGHMKLVVNLAEVNFMSSAGLRVFLATLKNVKAQNGDLKICGMVPGIQKIFKIAGFISLFDIVPDENQAVQKFA